MCVCIGGQIAESADPQQCNAFLVLPHGPYICIKPPRTLRTKPYSLRQLRVTLTFSRPNSSALRNPNCYIYLCVCVCVIDNAGSDIEKEVGDPLLPLNRKARIFYVKSKPYTA